VIVPLSALADISVFGPAEQAYLLQARQMQAMSFAVHIPLVCFGIAFPAMVLFVEWRSLRAGDALLRTLAQRWSKIMLTLFAAGVVTGTVLSFEMGLLWPGFTATFGSVFGLGFAIEGFSFFVEAIFIGVYVYGWNRLSPRAHLWAGIPVVIAGIVGAFMVISVNAWMNHPQGFTVRSGKVVDVNPGIALFANSNVWHEHVHMYAAAFIVVGSLVAAAYAVGRLRGRWGRYERTAFSVSFTTAAVTAPLQLLIGDWAARDVATTQPIKLAALEGLGTTTAGAPEHLLGWYSNGSVHYGIEIPHLLSLLSFHNPDAVVTGLDTVPVTDQPPINIVRIAFQTMVGIGTLIALLAVFYLLVRWRRRALPASPWFYRATVVAGPLSYVALVAGWVVTEVGRQPWVVYFTMRTATAVTGATGIPAGFALLFVVYVLLAVGVLWTLRRLAAAPLDIGEPPSLPGVPGTAPVGALAGRGR
jgi:cytochrome d ubiquinol oxidase subunit I